MNLDSHTIELACPRCQKKFTEQVGRLKRNPTVTCRGCGAQIKIEADDLRRATDTIQKSLDHLRRSLGKLGK